MKTAEGRGWCQKFKMRDGGFSLISWQTETAECSLAPFPFAVLFLLFFCNWANQKDGQKSRRLWEHLLFHPLCNIPGRSSIVFIVVKEFPLPGGQQKKRENTLGAVYFPQAFWPRYLEAQMQQDYNLFKVAIPCKIKNYSCFNLTTGGITSLWKNLAAVRKVSSSSTSLA